MLVRVLELVESCKMIRQLLDDLPEGDFVAPKVMRRVPAGAAVSY